MGMNEKALITANIDAEDFVANTNRFFQQTGWTLNDLHVYEPIAKVVEAVYALSQGQITEGELAEINRQAAHEIKAIDDELDKKYAA